MADEVTAAPVPTTPQSSTVSFIIITDTGFHTYAVVLFDTEADRLRAEWRMSKEMGAETAPFTINGAWEGVTISADLDLARVWAISVTPFKPAKGN